MHEFIKNFANHLCRHEVAGCSHQVRDHQGNDEIRFRSITGSGSDRYAENG